jgi:hypothetical protein
VCILDVSLPLLARGIWLTETAIWTGLARNLDEEGKALIKATGKVWKSGDQGAATAMVAAFDPKLNGMPDPILILFASYPSQLLLR